MLSSTAFSPRAFLHSDLYRSRVAGEAARGGGTPRATGEQVPAFRTLAALLLANTKPTGEKLAGFSKKLHHEPPGYHGPAHPALNAG